MGHRNDIMLQTYGYVHPPSATSNPLLLPAVDLPTYDPLTPFTPTPGSDDEFYGPEGSHVTVEEIERLKTLLKEMPTSAEEDAALLVAYEKGGSGEGKIRDWREKNIVDFRLQRKLALKRAIAKIEQQLASL